MDENRGIMDLLGDQSKTIKKQQNQADRVLRSEEEQTKALRRIANALEAIASRGK